MQRQPRTEAAVVNALIQMQKATDAERDQLADDLRKELAESDSEIRSNVKAMLAGHRFERIGVGLLILGVLLTLAGSVFSALA